MACCVLGAGLRYTSALMPNVACVQSLVSRVLYTCAIYPYVQTGRRSHGSLRHAPSEDETSVLREHALSLYNAAVNAVSPQQMVRKAMRVVDHTTLQVGDMEYVLNKNVHIAAFGKAVTGMIRAAEDILGDHVVGGVASIASGIQEQLRAAGKQNLLPRPGSRIQLLEGARNNIPDDEAFCAASRIHELASKLGRDDILLTLISGGGSALLPYPMSPITMEEMARATKVMAGSGATIQDLNTLRKNIEVLKGGGLAKAAHPAKVVSLILSDVIDSPLDIIASGPTVPDHSHPQHCLDLIERFGVRKDMPRSVLRILEEAAQNDTLASMNEDFSGHVQNLIVGSNQIAVETAYDLASDLGYEPYIMSLSLDGVARDVGEMMAGLAMYITKTMMCSAHNEGSKTLCHLEISLIAAGLEKVVIKEIAHLASQAALRNKPVCILAGGETVVDLRGTGKGGRNQEMALSAALHWDTCSEHKKKLFKGFCVQFLSAGTDGQDGPTEAAGALAHPHQLKDAQQFGLNPHIYLQNNDSYNFYRQLNHGKDHLMVGMTGTNVMDVQVLLIKQMFS